MAMALRPYALRGGGERAWHIQYIVLLAHES